MKIFLTIIAVLIIVILVVILVFTDISTNSSTDTPDTSSPAGFSGNNNISPDRFEAEVPEKLYIATVTGEQIGIKNFKTLEGVEYVGENMFHLNLGSYSILFNENNSSFAIYLSATPIPQVQRSAINALANTLDIKPEELCDLNVYVGTTQDIDPNYAGQNLGVGVCNN